MTRKALKKSILSLLRFSLIFSIINTPILGYSFTPPKTSTAIKMDEPTKEDNEKWQEQVTYAQQIFELQESVFLNSGRSSAEIDPFMMVRQQVIDDR